MQIQKSNILLLFITCLAFFLRIYKIDSVPPSLHGDEIGVGYNAFTLLTEGVDEYGKRFPFVFRADVGPAIFYATVPAIAIFGLTEFSTRFPSAVIGTLTVVIFYFLNKELWHFFQSYPLRISSTKIALFSSLFLAVSPWHIQISRITHDGAYGLLLQFAATLTFLTFIRARCRAFFYLAVILFGISFYAYHAPRITSPLLLILLIISSRKKFNFIQIIKAIMLLLLVVMPLITDFISKPLSQTRFGGINIFVGHTGSLPDIFRWPIIFLANFFKQFNPQVLFFDTSGTRYFNVSGNGLVYSWYILTLFFGFLLLWRNPRFFKFIFFCLVISVLPGALTSGPVNAGRIIFLLPLLELVSVLGLYQILSYSIIGRSLKVLLVIIITLNLYIFLNKYFVDSPQTFTREWQYGVKQIAQYALANEESVAKIIVSENIKQAYVYVLFYGHKSISQILSSKPKSEKHQFVGYARFGKYEFRKIVWDKDKLLKNVIIIGLADEIPQAEQTDIFRSPRGEALYISSRL